MGSLVPWMDGDEENLDFYDEEENEDYEDFLNKRNRKIREEQHHQIDKPHKYVHKKQRKKKNDDSDWLLM